MRIIINHLTRMNGGICVAGVDVCSHADVRPVLKDGQIPYSQLKDHGGLFAIGNEVDLGPVQPQPVKPETEDFIFYPSNARDTGRVDAEGFWSLLQAKSDGDLKSVFGPDLKRVGRHHGGMEPGSGFRSLGCIEWALNPQSLVVRRANGRSGRVILQVTDPEYGDLDLPVTDIRLFRGDHDSPDEEVVEKLKESLQVSPRTVLSVGLTRAWKSSEEYPALHWLQVNNIHLESDPLGEWYSKAA